ncbi:MAG: hypothetical protein AAF391_11350 [Bacteroidota bacterium]
MTARLLGLLGFILLTLCAELQAQQIIIDRPVKAGELTLFPTVGDENTYYYLPDKPRIATASNGKPQFSFLNYVENVRSEGNEKIREGNGGGIVHAVIELKVTEDQLKEARQALKRINSNGVIEGPIIYAGGTVALISSFADESGDLTEKVVGIGTAPILDGTKAAVSVRLTKLGAKILWESFQTPTPDMSISFEMQLKGFRAPKRGIIEANFDQIYEHQAFEAAVATPVLAAEIKAAFDDLVKTGAIKVTQIGEDEDMEKMIESAYGKLTRMMFDPSGGSGTPNLGQLASAGSNQKSMLDRATGMLEKARTEARQQNERNRRRVLEEASMFNINYGRSRNLDSEEGSNGEGNEGNESDGNTEGEATDNSGEEDFQAAQPISHEEGTRLEAEMQRERLRDDIEASQVPVPALAIAVSYEMKRVRQRGTFRIDLNKYTSDEITLRFDENFGQINCDDCFRQVNLDNPLYKQREINTYVDGMSTNDFGKYVNFVSIQLKKPHESGDFTNDEVTINKDEFNKTGNSFKLLYGWKGDNNREDWLNYEYKTVWNFFGGHMMESDWKTTTIETIPLSPPIRRQSVDIEADPETITQANIRANNNKTEQTSSLPNLHSNPSPPLTEQYTSPYPPSTSEKNSKK